MRFQAGLVLLVMMAIGAGSQPVRCQDNDDDAEVIKVETQSVQTTLRVSNAKGKPVGVNKDDLRLFMDGKEQEISFFAVDQVKKFVVLLDASDSMKGRRFDRSIKFLEKLADNALEGQSFDVVTFDTQTRFIGTITRNDKKSVFRRLQKMTPDGETALYQSVVETLTKFDRQAEPTAALIVITDGGDNSSSPEIKLSAEKYLARFGMMTYLIVLDTRMAYRMPENAPKDDQAKQAVKDFQKILQPVAYVVRYETEFSELAERLPRDAGFLVRIGFDPDDLKESPTGIHQLEIVHRNETLTLNYRRTFLTESFLAGKE